MKELTVIIPNYNGIQYLPACMDALARQTFRDFDVVFVDNGSTDESLSLMAREYPWVRVVSLPENTGFCHAVNVGIAMTQTEYLVLLNNDTEAHADFLKELYEGIRRHRGAFSGAAMMLDFRDRSRIDDAGNFYNALGWAFARGKGKSCRKYGKEGKIFAACAGAAIYRTALVKELGAFDEEHFAYLEDMDIGYRARIRGYENWYLPRARVYHVGSGTTGSRYNQFKIRYSSRNSIYLIYKNMPFLQILINSPFLLVGFGVKLIFFSSKGFGREYAAGIKNGFSISRKERKVAYRRENLGNYIRIQLELWINIIRRLAA